MIRGLGLKTYPCSERLGFRGRGLKTYPCSEGLVFTWCFGGNWGMDYKDYYWGLYRDYCGEPFLHSLLSTRD